MTATSRGVFRNGDGHRIPARLQLLADGGIVQGGRQLQQVLHGSLIVYQRLHGAGPLQLLQGLFRFYHRDRAGIAHCVDLDHMQALLHDSKFRPRGATLSITENPANER